MDRIPYSDVSELIWAPSAIVHRCHPVWDSRSDNTHHRKDEHQGNELLRQSFSLKEVWLERSGRSVSLSIQHLSCSVTLSTLSEYGYTVWTGGGKTPLRMLIFIGILSKGIYPFSSLMILWSDSPTLQEVVLQGDLCISGSGKLVITFSKPGLVIKKSEWVCVGGESRRETWMNTDAWWPSWGSRWDSNSV